MASTDITLIGLDEATLSDDLVTVLADPSTNGGYKASVGDLADYIIANAGLDYTDTATNGTYVKAVSESDGVISVTRETADTVPTEGSTKLITSGGVESALSMDLTSVSGNPITISDASNTNCETLVATLSPTQASGTPTPSNPLEISGVSTLTIDRAGRNLLDYATWSSETSAYRGTAVLENNGISLTATSNDSYTTVSTDMTPIRVLPNTNYVLSWESETNIAGQVYVFDGNLSVLRNAYASSQNIAFTTPSDCTEIYFRVGVQTSGNTIHYKNIQLALGDTALTTYEPYQGNSIRKNIAPFVDNIVSSVSGLTVTATSDDCIHISGTPSRTWADLTPAIATFIPSGTTITLSRSVSRGYSMFVTLIYTDGSTSELIVYSGTISATLTLSKDVSMIKLHLSYLSTSTNYDETIYPRLEIHTSTITINLGSTVYGGSVDLRSGVLTVDKVMVDLGDFDWNYISADNVFYNVMPTTCDYNAGSTDTLCSGFAYDTDATWYNYLGENQYMMCKDLYSLNRVSIAVKNTSVSTAEDFKTLVTGMKFVYPLATPTTTQLTPQTLRLLQGNNTLWTNAEGLEVEYQPNNFVGQLKAWILDQLS